MLGQIHYLAGEYEEAEMVFQRALEYQTWSPAANYNLAIVLGKRNRFREASEHFEKALAIDSFAVAPRIHLIRLYDQLGDSNKRLEHTRNLLGLRPDSEECSFLRTNGEKDLNSTLSNYEDKFLSEATSPSSEKTRALIATLKEDFPQAIARYKSHLQTLTQREKKKRITNEVLRLEGILSGKEPLLTPA
jgi:tetratricopeptide (TPR) repeat protein